MASRLGDHPLRPPRCAGIPRQLTPPRFPGIIDSGPSPRRGRPIPRAHLPPQYHAPHQYHPTGDRTFIHPRLSASSRPGRTSWRAALACCALAGATVHALPTRQLDPDIQQREVQRNALWIPPNGTTGYLWSPIINDELQAMRPGKYHVHRHHAEHQSGETEQQESILRRL